MLWVLYCCDYFCFVDVCVVVGDYVDYVEKGVLVIYCVVWIWDVFDVFDQIQIQQEFVFQGGVVIGCFVDMVVVDGDEYVQVEIVWLVQFLGVQVGVLVVVGVVYVGQVGQGFGQGVLVKGLDVFVGDDVDCGCYFVLFLFVFGGIDYGDFYQLFQVQCCYIGGGLDWKGCCQGQV